MRFELNNDQVASLRKMLNQHRHLTVDQLKSTTLITFVIKYKGRPDRTDRQEVIFAKDTSWRNFTVRFGDALKALPADG